MYDGKFISIEGGDGTGKSTQVPLLANSLTQIGIDVVTTREPGGAPGAEEIRQLLLEGEIQRWDPLTETLLHFAARRDHLIKTIFPALKDKRWIISDRFTDSTMAYQSYGYKLKSNVIKTINYLVLEEFVPNLTIILDIDPEISLVRAMEREGENTRYEKMDVEFHKRIRNGFLEIANKNLERCKLIDASGSINETHNKISEVVSNYFNIDL